MNVRTEHGFSVVGLLVLMPALVSIISVAAAAMLLISADAELKHECRTTLLDAQNEIAKDLDDLMKLNSPARVLRAERKAAEVAMRIAVNPMQVAAAQAALKAVQLRQLALAAQQKLIITRAKSKSASAPLKAKLKLHRSLREKARLIESRNREPQTKLRAASFDVVASPRESLTPDFVPAPGFATTQEMAVNAEWSVTTLLPEWLRRWLGRDDLKMKTTCRATIAKKGNEWRSLLKADKF